MRVRPLVIVLATFVVVPACAAGMRGTVLGGRSDGAVSGQIALGLGRAGTAAILLEPEVMVGASEDGPRIGGGVGADVMLQAPSNRLGFYVGPRFLASYDGRGAMHSGVEAGLLLVPLRSHHHYDPPSEKGGFILDDLFRSETRRVQLGLTARYEKIERFDDGTPDETRILVGATVMWSDISGHTEPARDDTPSRPAPVVVLPRSETVEAVVALDPAHAFAGLVASFGAAQPGIEVRIRTRTSVEWRGPVALLMYDEQTGATITPRIDVSYTLAPDGTGTRITAFAAAEPGDKYGPDAVMLWARRFRETVAGGMVLPAAELDPHPRMRVLIDLRTTPMHAHAGDCVYDAALAADAIEEVYATVTTPAQTELGVHWLGAATQIKPAALPALGLYDATVNFGLGPSWCGPTGTMPIRLDELARVDGGGSYPRSVLAARADAAAMVDPELAVDTEARRSEALATLDPFDGGNPMTTTVTRGDTATWLTAPERVRFTFVESVRADDATHTFWATVNRIIVVDVGLDSTSAAPVIVSNTVARADGRHVHE